MRRAKWLAGPALAISLAFANPSMQQTSACPVYENGTQACVTQLGSFCWTIFGWVFHSKYIEPCPDCGELSARI